MNKIYQQGKVDDTIPIAPGDENENETKIWIEKDSFKTRIRLKITPKNSRNILG